jgi:hypothetical protein
MNSERTPLTREERHRKRVRVLAIELRRQYLTAMKALERFVAEEDADDEGTVAILPGHAADLPQSGNRPPASLTNHR